MDKSRKRKTKDIGKVEYPLQPILPILVDLGLNSTLLYILLDSGSTETFIAANALDKVQVIRKSDRPIIQSVSGLNNTTTIPLYPITFQLGFDEVEGMVVPHIGKASPHCAVASEIDTRGYVVSNWKIPDNAYIDILLGSNCLWSFVQCLAHVPNKDAAVLVTHIGNALMGLLPVYGPSQPQPGPSSKTVRTYMQTLSVSASELDHDLSKKLDRLFVGEKDFEQDANLSPDHEHAIELFQRTMTFQNGQFCVSLMWKEHPELASNFAQARASLFRMVKKLKEDEQRYQDYIAAIEKYVTMGDVELVKNFSPDDHPAYYLPHRGVFLYHRLTTKVRPVFNGSFRTRSGYSLNDFLHDGPPLQPCIVNLLLAFRSQPVFLCGDISRMYMQILVKREDRDFLRFLWFSPSGELICYRFLKIIFGSRDSPFLAISCLHFLARCHDLEFPEASDILLRKTYVDDIICSVSSPEAAIQLAKDITILMSRASFTVQKWASNSMEVMKSIPPENRLIGDSLSLDPDASTKALGMQVSLTNDTIQFHGYDQMCDDKNTKRSIASLAGKVGYDPLGFLGPFIIVAKLILRSAHQGKIAWDSRVPDNLVTDWQGWLAQLPALSKVRFPRFTHPFTEGVQLHIFCDASAQAYGAVAYLRVWMEPLKRAEVHFLQAKARVAPQKELTIPNLELTAALQGALIYDQVQRVYPVRPESLFFWSDSTITLWWLQRQPHQLKTFQRNRVAKIQERGGQWQHVRSEDNPADLLSRGASPGMLAMPFWQNGPTWLSRSQHLWPPQPDIHPPIEPERMLRPVRPLNVFFSECFRPQLLEKFETLDKVLRITAFCLRWRQPAKTQRVVYQRYGWTRQGARVPFPFPDIRPITASEMKQALHCWIFLVQQEVFGDLLPLIEEKMLAQTSAKKLPKSSKVHLPALEKLNPQFHDKLLVVGSRVDLSLAQPQTILPKNHILTEKIIMKYHVLFSHAGPEWLLGYLREAYWILSGRRMVQKTINRCRRCHNLRLNPFQPIMAPLPMERVQPGRCFRFVGVDFTGPFYVLDGDNKVKTYLLLATCLVSRAVHLELVPNMTTEHFMLALRRMAARKGLPQILFSDNARTFKRGQRELEALLTETNVSLSEKLAKYSIEWKYVAEYASWAAGAWERLNRSIKEPLRTVMGRLLVSYVELETYIADIELLLNNRPLTTVTGDHRDLSPLTPAHLVYGRPLVTFPMDFSDLPSELPTSTDLVSRWKSRNFRVAHFWRRWRRGYLLGLSQRGRWLTRDPSVVNVDDVVILEDPQKPRNLWTLAAVKEVRVGRDGEIRTVLLKTPTSKKLLTRSIRQIYPLEGNGYE